MNDNDLNSRLVYSTSAGSICPECLSPKGSCSCRDKKKKALPENDGAVKTRYETKGRKGKGVTIISGLPLSRQGLLDMLGRLKRKFGTGGTVKEHTIELQGDFRRQAEQELKKSGYEA